MKGGDATVHVAIGLVVFPEWLRRTIAWEAAGKAECWGLTHF